MPNHEGNSAGGTAASVNCNAVDELTAENDRILTIRAVAKMFKMSTLELRLLEFRGLVRRRHAAGGSVFSWSDCEKIALLVKARKARLADRDVVPVLKAMTEETSASVIDAGRMKCLSLIGSIENRQTILGVALAELYRIDWELSKRRPAKNLGDIGVCAQQD